MDWGVGCADTENALKTIHVAMAGWGFKGENEVDEDYWVDTMEGKVFKA